MISASNIATALGGKSTGPGAWLCHCPAHDDPSPSLHVTEAEGGRTLVRCMAGCSQGAVIEALKRQNLWGGNARGSAATKPAKAAPASSPATTDGPVLVAPVPKAAPPPPTTDGRGKTAVAWWDYTDSHGRLMFRTLRFNAPGGGKSIRPATLWRQPDGSLSWELKGYPPPRPLYGLAALAKRPGDPIVVTEGEKAADAARGLLPGHVVIAWAHGAQSVTKSDWKPVRGRSVTIWPDNDAPGNACAVEVGKACYAAGASSVRLMEPTGRPDSGDDAADFTGTPDEAAALVRAGEEVPKPPEVVVVRERVEVGDLAAARDLAEHIKDRAMWVAEMKEWRWWDGTRWSLDMGERHIIGAAKDQAVGALEVAAASGSSDAMKTAKARHSLNRLHAAIELARTETGVFASATDLDADSWAFNCHNGTLDLRAGTMRAHAAADRISKICGAAYDRDAKCPRWTAFIDEIFMGDQDLVSFVQRAVGYSLTGSAREQCMFVAYGGGANGKSVFLSALRAVLGDYATQADSGTLLAAQYESKGATREDLLKLKGARFVAAAEVTAGRRLDEAGIKAMTGGEPVVARPLYGKPVEFLPGFKIWFAVNHLPDVHGQDLGIWRRLRVIPFNYTVPADRRDPELYAKLVAEASGILAWAVQGCADWRRNGLGTGVAIETATAEYKADSDVMGVFLDTRIERSNGSWIASGDLYQAWRRWRENNGGPDFSAKRFGALLKERGYTTGRFGHAQVRGWAGVQLRLDDDPEEALFASGGRYGA